MSRKNVQKPASPLLGRPVYAPTCGHTGCADSFERGKTDSVPLLRDGFSSGPVGRFTVARRQTLSPSVVWSIGPLPAWHVERPRKSPKWLLAFVAAISCCQREISRARACIYARAGAAWKIAFEAGLTSRTYSATKCLHARARRFMA